MCVKTDPIWSVHEMIGLSLGQLVHGDPRFIAAQSTALDQGTHCPTLPVAVGEARAIFSLYAFVLDSDGLLA